MLVRGLSSYGLVCENRCGQALETNLSWSRGQTSSCVSRGTRVTILLLNQGHQSPLNASLPCFWNLEPSMSVLVAPRLLCEAGHLQSILELSFSLGKLGCHAHHAHLRVVEIKGDCA